jgi:tRNA (uracil-5-)-methyltransferase
MIVRSYDRIIYISCNPDALVLDLKSLLLSHELVRLAVFDTFAYTSHLEVGVFLKKR